MACFAVPAVTAVITTAIAKKVPEKYHINWLNWMLWGGSLMLLVEHISQKEIVFYPPFFTAGTEEIFSEMLKVGLPMTLATLLVWVILVWFNLKFSKVYSKTINLKKI